jgi:hypothetical protein
MLSVFRSGIRLLVTGEANSLTGFSLRSLRLCVRLPCVRLPPKPFFAHSAALREPALRETAS